MNSLEVKINNQSNEFNIEIERRGFLEKKVFTDKTKNVKYIFFSLDKNNESSEELKFPEDFLKKHNGIIIAVFRNNLKIYVDKIRTIPLYIYKKGTDLLIFSDFNSFYKNNFNREIDIVGFWENLIFENALRERTLFKYVKQFTFASVAVFDKNLDYKFEKYWNFSLPKADVKNEDEAVEILNEHLNRIFSSLNPSNKYLLPISGGLDSKLTLAVMSRFIPPQNLSLMTFGYNERIREYKYAKKVAKALGYKKPVFHQLTPESYARSLKPLVRKAAGTIGIQHCHTYDFLKSKNFGEHDYMISTTYSDPVFGWAVNLKTRSDKGNIFENTSQYNKISKFCEKFHINNDIKNNIIEDLKYIYNLWLESTTDSFEEFFYHFERNVKFHINYGYILSDNIKLFCPFFDLGLIEYLFSLPAKYRHQKRIINLFFGKYFPELNKIRNISSSSRFQSSQAGNITLDFIKFKILNRVNVLLSILTCDRFQIFNEYITENQKINIRLHHRKLFIKSLKKIKSLGLFNKRQFKLLKDKPHRTNLTNLQYQIISIKQALRED